MSSGQPRTLETKTNSVTQPFGPALAGYEDLFKRGTAALDATNSNPFTGNFVAQTGADFTSGLNNLRTAVPSLGAGADPVQDLAMKTATGGFLTPDSNPFLKAMGEAAIRPLNEQFTNTVLPGITDQAIAQGAYGGSGQDISQERAAKGLATASGDTLANLYGNAYAQERQLQQNAPALFSAANSLRTAPGMMGLQIDEFARQGKQLGLDNALQKYQARQQAPWYGLGEMANLLASAGMRSTTGASTQPNPQYVDPMTNALKMALGGAAGVAGIGGSGGFGLWGMPKAA